MEGALWLGITFVALQVADIAFVRQVMVPRSLSVGPAVVVIAVIVGFEIYGVGAALFGAILAIFAIAMLDAAGGVVEAAEAEPERGDGDGAGAGDAGGTASPTPVTSATSTTPLPPELG
ncbi:MAG TPA: hypothetical protein VIL36_13095, partial [Acidimicrobiales bacterium]